MLYGRGYPPERLLYSAYVGDAGIFGLPLGIAANIVIVFLTFGALGITWWASNWLYAYWLARRSPEVGVEKELTFTATGITSRSELEYSESTWANFTSVLETEEHFLLYRGRAEFVPIPKRDLAESMAQDRFRELLRTKIRDARLLA